jgi:hypothetical protein
MMLELIEMVMIRVRSMSMLRGQMPTRRPAAQKMALSLIGVMMNRAGK